MTKPPPVSPSPVDTAKVAGRRMLRFESISAVLAEVDRLAEAERAGLAKFVQRGGLLVASSAAGLKPFDKAFKRELGISPGAYRRSRGEAASPAGLIAVDILTGPTSGVSVGDEVEVQLERASDGPG